jgi:hypothetical protein
MSFDLRRAPTVPGLFLGDYSALASVDSTFLTLFAQSNTAAAPATVYFSVEP